MTNKTKEPLYPLLFDIKKMRPGCVILQAVAGGCRLILDRHFTDEDWLVDGAAHMRVMYATDDQWRQIAERSHKMRANKSKPQA